MSQLIFEIGCEEIPARFMRPALDQLLSDFLAACAEARINTSGARAVGTPRRLTLLVDHVAATQTDQRRHAVSNIDVTPTSDTSATARAYGIVTAADETGLRIAVSCAYTADLTFGTDGLWRFARLWIGMDHYAGNAPKMHT